MRRALLHVLVASVATWLACIPLSAGDVGAGASLHQQSPQVASPSAPLALDVSAAGVANITQDMAAIKAELQAAVDAKLAEFNKTVVNETDVWLNRGIIGLVAAFVVWWARFQARQHGYVVQRRKRLEGCGSEAGDCRLQAVGEGSRDARFSSLRPAASSLSEKV